jgi:hypothetical protein
VVCIVPNLVFVHADGITFSARGVLVLIHHVRCGAVAPAEPALGGARLETGQCLQITLGRRRCGRGGGRRDGSALEVVCVLLANGVANLLRPGSDGLGGTIAHTRSTARSRKVLDLVPFTSGLAVRDSRKHIGSIPPVVDFGFVI